eukprot:m.240022 g.240022  ORF g.240022 m.240022 type:complete len:397 (-) comp14376_c0_seq1:44-1234(-)
MHMHIHIQCTCRVLVALSKPDGVLSHVEDGCVCTDEHVAKDPQGAHWWWHIKAHESAEALCLTRSGDLKHVLIWCKCELRAIEDNVNVGHGWDLAAVDHVLALGNGRCANCLLQLLDLINRASNKRGSGVGNGLAVGAIAVAIHSEVCHLKLPVAVLGEGHPCDWTRDLSLVVSTEGHLTASAVLLVAVEPERKHVLFNSAFLDEVVPEGNNVVDADLSPAHTENTIKLSSNKSKSWLNSGLGKRLLVHTNLTSANLVNVEESSESTRAVLDLELCSVWLVRGRLGAVVLLVDIACEGLARLSGDPKVGAASVKHNLEGLWWCSNCNRTIVLGIFVVGEGDVGGAVQCAVFGSQVCAVIAERLAGSLCLADFNGGHSGRGGDGNTDQQHNSSGNTQ